MSEKELRETLMLVRFYLEGDALWHVIADMKNPDISLGTLIDAAPSPSPERQTEEADWVLVPKEPTIEMVRAGYASNPNAINAAMETAYRAMIEAAPIHTERQTDDDGRSLLAEALVSLKHTRVFISTREKMHPVGRELQEELIKKIQNYLGETP